MEVSATAEASIRAHARFIAIDRSASEESARWVARIERAVATLRLWPRRCGLAEENAALETEVRRLVVGEHLILFTIDDRHRVVRVLGVRRGQQRPRPGELGVREAAPHFEYA